MLSVVTSTQVNQLTSELSLNWPQQGGIFCFSSHLKLGMRLQQLEQVIQFHIILSFFDLATKN